MLIKGVRVHHDNAQPHTAHQTTALIEEFEWELVSHPPYSPDVAPTDFHFFRDLKKNLVGTQFQDDNELKEAVLGFLRGQAAEFFDSGFHKWKAVHGIETSERKVKDEVDTQTPANKTPKISILDHFSSVSIDRSTDAVLARMIALDGLPFSVFVTSKDLHKCLNALGHEIPLSAETIKIKVCRYADTFREKPYQGVESWLVTRISGVFSSEQCKYVIGAKLLEFGIDFETDIVCVTTDGCAMMVKLGHIIGPLQQLCYAHGLHLAVMDVLYDKKKERVVPEFVFATVNEAESDLSEDDNEDTSPFNVSLKKKVRPVLKRAISPKPWSPNRHFSVCQSCCGFVTKPKTATLRR
ncbi:hypothetical protein LAZ67_8000576 [Cordylochernes scorpioides]|uniref:Histone-lysine N-methyltransferase SETMAR n=1 Tax=Cordylochernes scorpioides TaxID=51811 RepID=A0ABY6KPI1_9ARAC|nr:hypothetical protein LAZ67_8000576 [Cordylochernes scorpioides]